MHNVSELFELAPCEGAFHVYSTEGYRLDLLVRDQISFYDVEAALCQRVSAQVNLLYGLGLDQFFEQLLGAQVSNLAVGQAHFDQVLADTDGCSYAFGPLRPDGGVRHLDHMGVIFHDSLQVVINLVNERLL